MSDNLPPLPNENDPQGFPSSSSATPAVWSPAATGGFGCLIFIVFTAVQIGVLVIWMGIEATQGIDIESQEFMQSMASNGAYIALATIASALVCSALIAWLIRMRNGATIKDYLAFTPVANKTIWLTIGITLLFILVSDSLTTLLGKDIINDFMRNAWKTQGFSPLFWFALVVAAPFFEEIFFRGFLFEGLRYSALEENGTIVITALFWAAIHLQYDLYAISIIFVMGVVLGLLRSRTGSIWPCILMHALNNLIATIETAYLV